jgi:glutaredoxin
MSIPKIILYTNRGCPWAHRAHIALKELGLEYEEVTIDLSKPREPWYLDVNPVSTRIPTTQPTMSSNEQNQSAALSQASHTTTKSSQRAES